MGFVRVSCFFLYLCTVKIHRITAWQRSKQTSTWESVIFNNEETTNAIFNEGISSLVKYPIGIQTFEKIRTEGYAR